MEDKILDLVTEGKTLGRVARGINEATKASNKGNSKLIIVAADSVPLEITLHLPEIAEDKGSICIFVSSMQKLGAAMKLSRPCMAVALVKTKAPTAFDAKIEALLNKLDH